MEGIITNDIVYNTVNNSGGGTEQYEFIISLGSFCSPAIELERYGFRDSSYPFDWLLTHTFETVLDLIDNDFVGFLDGNRLYQRSRERQVYENTDLDISFVHDFSKYESLSNQLEMVQEKYRRREERLYHSISKPTLFLRYIESKEQFTYVANHSDEIIRRLKSYNPNNQIVFIANDYAVIDGLKRKIGTLYIVTPDENDMVARSFFDQCEELVNYLMLCYPSDRRVKNLKVYRDKVLAKRINKVPHKFRRLYEKMFLEEYEHTKFV